jgi:hypothetical protein
MPVKTDEKTRNLIVNLRREGKSYNEIQRTVNVSGPTVAGVLKEAGMTQAKKPPSPKVAGQSSPQTKPSSYTSTQSQTMRQGTGNGVDDLQPPPGPKRVKPEVVGEDEVVEIQCDHCGVILHGKPGDPMPETCPECGS